MSELAPVNSDSEVSVVTLLERAGEWLSTAVARSEPVENIATMKAQVATAAEATKQLGLSKEIQLDAQEMVRRAEYTLGKAIRKGQAEGNVAMRGSNQEGLAGHRVNHGRRLTSPTDLASRAELNGSGDYPGIYALADADDPTFEPALPSSSEPGMHAAKGCPCDPMRRREWAVIDRGRLVTDPDWHCPADVMRGTHAHGTHGPIRIAYRDIDEHGLPSEWIELQP